MAEDSFLENCQGWTPSPDVLVRKKRYGFEGAYLWGRLRRLCQMGKGTYTISHEAIGNRIGMSRRTVIKYLDRLIEDGYVDDLTPDVRNKPHTYSVKRGEDKILAELQDGMQISHTESTTPEQTEVPPVQDNDVGMRNLHTSDENRSAEIAQQDGIGVQELPSGMQNLHSGYAENAQDGMQNLHLKRESLDTLLEIEESALPEKLTTIPAVEIHAKVFKRRCLNGGQVEEIITVVGCDPVALVQWRKVLKAWNLAGYKPTNVGGQLDWFRDGIPVHKNGAEQNGQPVPPKKVLPVVPIDAQRLRELQQESGLIDSG